MKEGLLGGTLSVSSGRPTLIQHGSPSLEMAEALTNVVKHARATRATVWAAADDGVLALEVRDDGIGGAQPNGHGLMGIAAGSKRQAVGCESKALTATGWCRPRDYRTEGAAVAAQSAGPGIAPSASLIRVQTFMLTTTPTIPSISSGQKCSTSASWKRWNAAS